MSKELTPLEALKRIRQETIPATYNQDFDKEECCKIIETALKKLEKIDDTKLIFVGNPNPDHPNLDKLLNHSILLTNPQQMEIKPLYDESDEKKLKALEIIEEKRVDVDLFLSSKNLTHYNDFINEEKTGEKQLTQEEFDLIKEALND